MAFGSALLEKEKKLSSKYNQLITFVILNDEKHIHNLFLFEPNYDVFRSNIVSIIILQHNLKYI